MMKSDSPHDPNYISRSEIRERGPAVRPKDAATLIIVSDEEPQARVLLGKRSAAHKFMPNKFVFPGGKVDRADGRIAPPRDLHPEVLRRLCTGCSPVRARALALAAIRETFEETGLILGEPESPTLKTRSASWADFLQHDMNPRLDVLHYVARAITPPYRNRRFDARFFMVDAKHIHGGTNSALTGSGELLNLHWIALSQAKELDDLPHITRAVLAEVEKRLQAGFGPGTPGPFVRTLRGKSIVESV